MHSIISQSYKNIELIVVDKSSTDATQKIAKKYTDHVFVHGPERSAQRNFGVKRSTGSYICIIDSDMELSKDVIKNALLLCQKNATVKAIVIPEESFGVGFWAQCKRLERSFYIGVKWMEAARFFDREVYEKMNGYDERVTGGEDYDLPQRIEHHLGRNAIASISDMIYHNEGRLRLYGLCKKKYYYGRHMDRYRCTQENKRNYSKQSSVLYRYGLYFSHPVKLFKNPFLGIGLLFMKTCEFGCAWSGLVVRKFIKTDHV